MNEHELTALERRVERLEDRQEKLLDLIVGFHRADMDGKAEIVPLLREIRDALTRSGSIASGER